MPIEITEKHGGRELVVRPSGKLTKPEYQFMAQELERLIHRHGKLRVLFDMTDFSGWEAAVLWEDIKFDAKHYADLERLALIGEKKWHHAMAVFCQPFTTATVKYFENTDAAEAQRWLEEGLAS